MQNHLNRTDTEHVQYTLTAPLKIKVDEPAGRGSNTMSLSPSSQNLSEKSALVRPSVIWSWASIGVKTRLILYNILN